MEIASGTCGQNVGWRVFEDTNDLILVIEGKGPMADYGSRAEVPYAGYRDRVTKVVVNPGVTTIGDYAFSHFVSLTSVELPPGVTMLGCFAFAACVALESLALPEGLRIIGPKSLEKCTSLKSVSLPSTLRAIDFKAFKASDNLTRVYYAGTPVQWEKQVRVSRSSLSNKPLLSAEFTFRETTLRNDDMLAIINSIIKAGGDSRLYVIAPDLTVDNVAGKSGDCLLILFPDGKTMMVDSGVSYCGERVMQFVSGTGLQHLDYFVLTHPHADHIGNAMRIAQYLFETMSGHIDTYFYTGYEGKKDTEKQLAAYLSEHGTKLQRDVRAGHRLDVGGVKIEVFNPFDGDMHPDSLSEGTVNNTSLLMKFTYGNSTFLTGGDLYADREAMLVEKYGTQLAADVAKTNHHGCFTSNSDLWLDTVNPKILLSTCDDILWTLFSEKLAEKNIRHYKVSDYGLTVISMGRDADYQVETEF